MNHSSSLLLTQMIYVTTRTWNSSTDIAISLLHFTTFFQGEDKASKEVKTIISRGIWRVSLMPMRLSALSTPVTGIVTSHMRRVVFLIVFSLQQGSQTQLTWGPLEVVWVRLGRIKYSTEKRSTTDPIYVNDRAIITSRWLCNR